MSKSILVVDDSLAMQRAIEDALAEDDYRLEFMRDGIEAEASVRKQRPDLILADAHLPGRSGYDISMLAKEQYDDVPVLLLVGAFESFDASSFERCGADAWLKKPFDPDEFRQQIGRLLEGRPSLPGQGDDDEGSTVQEGDFVSSPQETDFVSSSEETDLVTDLDDGGGLAEADAGTAEDSAPAEEPATVDWNAVLIESSDREVAAGEPRTGTSESGSPALSAEDIDRIAQRVVEIAGDGVLREIAWEVVPDLAEVIIRERLDQLESELDESS